MSTFIGPKVYSDNMSDLDAKSDGRTLKKHSNKSNHKESDGRTKINKS